MATYIQGVTDYIPQIQPFQPDLNFYGNVMQTRQTRFDAAKKKINDLYGTLLYSPMSRDVNIKRREEFFKVIDEDIKRISGLDLSMQQNVDQAVNVFSSFYDDKYMVTDMVKTRNYHKELEKGENYKYCVDPAKCNGQYWEQGIKKLHYKMEEFKNVSDDESLHFQIGEYDPYFDWKKEAATKAKELGYDVKLDTPSGKWIVKDVNGKLVEGGLYNLFTTLYGDDPRVKNNYDTEAYVARKDYSKMLKDTYGSEEEAEKNYVMRIINQGMTDTRDQLKDITDSYNQMNDKYLKLQKKLTNKTITAREKQDLEEIIKQKPALEMSKNTLETRLNEIQKNIDANDFNGLKRRADISAATTYQKRDLTDLAKSLSQIKQSRTLEVNPYTKMYEEFGLQKQLAKYKAQLESELAKQKFEYDYAIKVGKKPGETVQSPTEYLIEAVPGTTAKQNIEDSPDFFYEQNRQESLKRFNTAAETSKGMLYKLFNAAKNAYTSDTGKNSGALSFLSQFGDWSNIRNSQDFEKAIANKKISSISTFESFISKANSNNPGGDYMWAKSLIENPEMAVAIDRTMLANQAFNKLTQKNWDVNKRVINQVKATAGENNYAANFAGLLLNKYNTLETEEGFVKKLIADQAKQNVVISERQASNIYEALKEQFYEKYNNEENVGIMQGEGLPGGGMTSSRAVQYSLDLAQKGEEPTVTNVVNLVGEALTKVGTSKAVIGDMSKESFAQADDQGVKEFLTWYLNEPKSDKSTTRRALTATISNVAGENPNIGAVTLKGFDPNAIQEYIGSAKNKNVFFGKDLTKGLTVFFDRNTIKTNAFDQPMSDLEVVLKTNGSAVTKGFEETAGHVEYSLDGSDVYITVHTKSFRNGQFQSDSPRNPIRVPISKLKEAQANIERALATIQAANLESERKASLLQQ